MNKSKTPVLMIKFWYVYLIWIIFSVFVWSWTISAITAFKPSETLNLFVCCYGIEKESFENHLLNNPQDGVKKVNIFYAHPSDIYYYTIYRTHGNLESQIFILPERKLKEDAAIAFLSLEPDLIESYLGPVEYYYENDVAYGIKVFDKESGKGCAKNYLTYMVDGTDAENYYLAFNAGIVRGENSFSDKSIKIVKRILETKNEKTG